MVGWLLVREPCGVLTSPACLLVCSHQSDGLDIVYWCVLTSQMVWILFIGVVSPVRWFGYDCLLVCYHQSDGLDMIVYWCVLTSQMVWI